MRAPDCKRFICKIHNLFSVVQLEFDYRAVSIFRIAETVYKCVANINTTAHGRKKMNTQRTLDAEKVKEFVGDFNKFLKI